MYKQCRWFLLVEQYLLHQLQWDQLSLYITHGSFSLLFLESCGLCVMCVWQLYCSVWQWVLCVSHSLDCILLRQTTGNEHHLGPFCSITNSSPPLSQSLSISLYVSFILQMFWCCHRRFTLVYHSWWLNYALSHHPFETWTDIFAALCSLVQIVLLIFSLVCIY